MNMSIEAFKNDDIHLARQVEPLEEVIDYLNDELKQRHVRRLRSGECSVELGFVLSDITINYERVADHCSNLAVDLLRIHENVFDVHEYLEGLKKTKMQHSVKPIRRIRQFMRCRSHKEDKNGNNIYS